jgi:SAM-dependent methyltransferase
MLELHKGKLLEAWESMLAGLGVEAEEHVLLGGPGAENLAIELGAPVADATGSLVSLGLEAALLAQSAVPFATELPTDSFDAVVMLSAWESPTGVGPVVREAARLTRPGGSVWVGDMDGHALVRATPATYPSALLYMAHPEIGAEVAAACQPSSLLGVEMVRAGMRAVTSDGVELPIAVLADGPEYIEAVRAGMWPGVESVSADDVDDVLSALRLELVPPIRFPFVEYRPWVMVRGAQPE